MSQISWQVSLILVSKTWIHDNVPPQICTCHCSPNGYLFLPGSFLGAFFGPELRVPLLSSGLGSILTPALDRVLPICLRRTDRGHSLYSLVDRPPCPQKCHPLLKSTRVRMRLLSTLMKLELHYGKDMVRWELEKIVVERNALHIEQYCSGCYVNGSNKWGYRRMSRFHPNNPYHDCPMLQDCSCDTGSSCNSSS